MKKLCANKKISRYYCLYEFFQGGYSYKFIFKSLNNCCYFYFYFWHFFYSINNTYIYNLETIFTRYK